MGKIYESLAVLGHVTTYNFPLVHTEVALCDGGRRAATNMKMIAIIVRNLPSEWNANKFCQVVNARVERCFSLSLVTSAFYLSAFRMTLFLCCCCFSQCSAAAESISLWSLVTQRSTPATNCFERNCSAEERKKSQKLLRARPDDVNELHRANASSLSCVCRKLVH